MPAGSSFNSITAARIFRAFGNQGCTKGTGLIPFQKDAALVIMKPIGYRRYKRILR